VAPQKIPVPAVLGNTKHYGLKKLLFSYKGKIVLSMFQRTHVHKGDRQKHHHTKEEDNEVAVQHSDSGDKRLYKLQDHYESHLTEQVISFLFT
jgi:hypothetical protein